MKPYIIATWSDGTQLVRPWVLEDEDTRVHWNLVDSTGVSVALITIVPENLNDLRRWRSAVIVTWYDLRTEAGSGAIIWAIHRLIKVYGPKIDVPRIIPAPRTGSMEDQQGLVNALEVRIAWIFDRPPEDREQRWEYATSNFLRIIMRANWGPGRKQDNRGRNVGTGAGKVGWTGLHGKHDFWMAVPSLSDIEKGAGPVWSVHKKDDASPLGSSAQSPYRALLKAGLFATDSDHAIWMAGHGLPGALSEGLQMYQMLGLTLPVLWPTAKYREWVVEQES